MTKSQVWIRQTQLSDEQSARVGALVAESRARLLEALAILREAVEDDTLRPTDKLSVLVGEGDRDGTLIATPVCDDGEEYTECLVFHGGSGACHVEVCDCYQLGRPAAPPAELPQRLRASSFR